MAKKMGRPKLPKGKSRTYQVGIRFTEQEMRKINRAARRFRVTTSKWIRAVLLFKAAQVKAYHTLLVDRRAKDLPAKQG